MFEIKNRDIAGRIGTLEIENKKLETPVLLPVINPKKQIISPKEIFEKYKVKAIMTNAYIIFSNKDLRNKVLEVGLHNYLNFHGIVETDSGAYQILHYKKNIEVSNKEIVEFQIKIGSNIINVLDLPTDVDKRWEEAKQELYLTINRIKEGIEIKKTLNSNALINGAIQGGIYLDLRKLSAIEVSKLDIDIYAIGTIVPYMINYDFHKLFETIIIPRILLPLEKPVHLFGLGHPLVIPLSVAIGCDIFDSASYVLYANDNRIITYFGTLKLEELEDFYLNTKNKDYHVSEIKDMPKEERNKIISEHNLFTLLKEISIVRDAIKNQYLFDLVLFKAHYHKSLYKATKFVLNDFYDWLKRLDPIRKRSGIVYGGDLLEIRTDVKRAIERLKERVDPKDYEYLYDYVFPFNSIKNDKVL